MTTNMILGTIWEVGGWFWMVMCFLEPDATKSLAKMGVAIGSWAFARGYFNAQKIDDLENAVYEEEEEVDSLSANR